MSKEQPSTLTISFRIVILSALALTVILVASTLTPTGFLITKSDFSVQATSINACTSSWTANTTYELTADITNDDGNCMVIDANNVTLDCMGYTIDGDGDNTGSGVLIADYNQTTVQNCTIKEFNDNIRVAGAITVDHTFRNNNLSAPGNSLNMYLDDAVRVLVHNNTFNDNGLELSYSISGTESNSTIELNTFHSIAAKVSGTGLIYLHNGNNVTVQYNFFNSSVITDSADYGIDLLGGSNYTIQFNNFTNLDGYSVIMFENSENSDVVIRNNNISNNRRRGINGDFLTRSVIANNTIDSNALQGIYLLITNLTEISGNNITNNLQGIHLNHGSADNNTITGNNISLNSNVGLNISNADAANNVIYNNYFNNTLNARDVTANLNFWNISPAAGTSILCSPTVGGNFWHDYAGVDNNADYVGDTLLPYNSSENITSGGDFAPLIVDNSTDTPALTVHAPVANQNITTSTTFNGTINETFAINSVQYQFSNASGNVTGWTSLLLESGNRQNGVWNASYDIATLSNGTYNVTFNATDCSGRSNITVVQVTVDATAPAISNRATTVTTSSITITWNTDENANYSINYGTTASNLNSEANTNTFATSHSQILSSLSESTKYYYNITAWDVLGNRNESGPFDATTSASSTDAAEGGGGGSSTATAVEKPNDEERNTTSTEPDTIESSGSAYRHTLRVEAPAKITSMLFDVIVENLVDRTLQEVTLEIIGLPQGTTYQIAPEITSIREGERATFTVILDIPAGTDLTKYEVSFRGKEASGKHAEDNSTLYVTADFTKPGIQITRKAEYYIQTKAAYWLPLVIIAIIVLTLTLLQQETKKKKRKKK